MIRKISVNIPEELNRNIRIMAAILGLNMTDYIVRAINNQLVIDMGADNGSEEGQGRTCLPSMRQDISCQPVIKG
jgi:hypothetical protein